MEQMQHTTRLSPVTRLIQLGIDGDVHALRAAALMVYNSDQREVGSPSVDEWYKLPHPLKTLLLNTHPAFTTLNEEDRTKVRVLLCRC